MKKIVPVLAIASMLLFSGCGKNEKADTGKPVIKVNDSVITRKMIDSSIKKESAMLGNLDAEKDEDKFLYLIYKNKTVNDLIIKELLRQEAVKRNITVSEEEIDDKIQKLTEQVGGKSKFDSYFSANKINKKDFRKKIEFDLLNDKIVEDLAGKKAPDEKEIKAFYEKNKDEYFKHPEQVKASHILISASEPMIRARIESDPKESKALSAEEVDEKVKEELAEAKIKAKKILAEVKADPEKFEEIARKKSQDPSSAKKGGDLGFFAKNKMVPSFSKAAFDIKPGKISELVKTEYGYHIIKVVDRKKAGVVPFDEVKIQIGRYLNNKKKTNELKKLLLGLKNKAEIEFLDDNYNPEKIQKEIKEQIKNQQTKKKPVKKTAPDLEKNKEVKK